MQFSEIKVKFKEDDKIYKISVADIREYDRSKESDSYKYLTRNDMYIYDIIEEVLYNNFNEDLEFGIEHNIEHITFEVANILGLPMSFVKNKVFRYIENRDILMKNRKKGNSSNVTQLVKAISNKVTHRIIYLPTYRRIENDFGTLNIRNEELNRAELIKFGMSDVQNSIERILEKIRSLAMEGFAEMTGVLLKQYVDGVNPVVETQEFIREKFVKKDINVTKDIVEIVLNRVGKKIEKNYKEKIINLIEKGDIWEDQYFYLLNLISKLIDNYKLQKKYDDRIKKFADTCNKYMNDKHFSYNQSTLDLQIHLNYENNKKEKVISLTQLSSGEKQIVSLFSKLYLESDEPSIIIIDEPELSLSLNWQKMLLPDIIRTNKCDLLLTATHSPFIFENQFDEDAKEMRRYIKEHKRG